MPPPTKKKKEKTTQNDPFLSDNICNYDTSDAF